MLRMNRVCWVWVGLAACCAAMAAEDARDAPGLTVREDGVLLRKGEPYRAVGMNYFNVFSRLLENPDDTSYRKGLEDLAAHKVPFVRLMMAGYYPSNWKLYTTDKTAYFALMDKVVKAAEETGVGLVPSLFFASPYVCDVVGEPRKAWGDPASKTHAFMREYVREVVTRYKDSDAIWAWEFANEFNLDVDLPNAADHRPPVVPHWGTPTTRSADDDIGYEVMIVAFREFGKAVREHDQTRPVTNGASLPRPAAEHLRTQRIWADDTREQFQKNLIETSPAPLNLVSVHMYPFDETRFGEKDVPYEETLRLAMEACRKAGQALFVGEFGSSDDMEGGPEAARREFEAMLAAIERTGVPLAAVWVYDLEQQAGTLSIRPDNNRRWMLDAVAEVNRRLGALKP